MSEADARRTYAVPKLCVVSRTLNRTRFRSQFDPEETIQDWTRRSRKNCSPLLLPPDARCNVSGRDGERCSSSPDEVQRQRRGVKRQ